LKTYRDVRLADPFLRPYWRHERVISMLASVPPERCKRYDDVWIRDYKKFLFAWRKDEGSRDKLLHDNPGMFFAYLLHDKMHVEPELRLMIEARLLAGQSAEDIAHEAKTIPETVKYYEKLFFNVADFLPHHDWIVKHVLIPASDRFAAPEADEEEDDDENNDQTFTPKPAASVVKPHLDMTLKFFAYFGGPLICDTMISGFRRNNKITSPEDIPNFFDEQFTSQIQKRSAQAAGQFQINQYNVMELFATHSRLIEVQNGAGSAEDKHSDIEKSIGAMLTELPWSVGARGTKIYEDTPLGRFDNSAVELDGEELLLIAAGHEPDGINDAVDLTIASRKEPDTNAKSN
jgi:hypothetical protein